MSEHATPGRGSGSGQGAGPGRVLAVDGLVNARDLGGLPLLGGGSTPRGAFFRSETVDAIRPAGWQQLHAAGIRTVLDLRRDDERALDTQARPGWLTTVQIDLDGLENERFWADFWDNRLVATARYFLPHLAAMPERTGAVLSALAQARGGGVLFHCAGGRDRTGMVAMVLLSLAGVEPEAIVDDYLETVRLGEVRAAATGRGNEEPEIERLLRRRGTSTERAFRDALIGLDLDRLLDAAGIDPATREILRSWRGTLPPRPARQWCTKEEIAAARRGFEARLPGWRAPVAHAVVLVAAGDSPGFAGQEPHFPVINREAHLLPAAVLALVGGRARGTVTLELSPQQLAHAIDLLAPAEAAPMYDHPNLRAWRELRARWRDQPGARLFAVFVDDLDDPISSEYDRALRARLTAPGQECGDGVSAAGPA